MKCPDRIQIPLAKWIVNSICFLSKLFRFGEGSNFPGRVALTLFPDLFTRLVPRFTHGWIVVTGTNGKTTTTKILVEMMAAMGIRVVTNARGANLITGIVTSILNADIDVSAEYFADYAVFEIDEAVLGKSFHLIQPGILIVTNFSRDQLDRYGEVDSNVNKIMDMLRKSDKPCRVVLNGNDPNIARIGQVVAADERVYFGINEEIATSQSGLLVEKDTGTAWGGAFEMPKLDIWADQIETHYLSGSRFQFGFGTETETIHLKLPGVFNILNALAAAAVVWILHGNPATVIRVLEQVAPSYGRSESFTYKGIPVFMFLVKNPVGFNHILQLLAAAPGRKRLLLLLNDLTADGKDVSWIWDVSLENLWRVKDIQEIVTSGTRAGDMALRVKYSEPPAIPLTVDYSPRRAFRDLAVRMGSDEQILILANYTSMIQFRPFLLKVCGAGERDKRQETGDRRKS